MKFFDEYRSCMQTFAIADSAYADLFNSVLPPVTELYVCSHNLEDILTRKRVSIVGTRKVTPYGRQVTERFARELAGQGIVIISGLAFGVDSIAHEAALSVGGLTIAVLPSSLSRIYPAAHTGLARRILEQGGALVSEYPVGTDIAFKNQFVERNRIVAGMADAILITEAAKDSGTMHTARFANEQNRDVFAVPGNITSPSSEGVNNLLRASKAHPALCTDDILHALGMGTLEERPPMRGRTANEQVIIDLITANITSGDDILERSGLAIQSFNEALTMLEIFGTVYALGNNHWAIR